MPQTDLKSDNFCGYNTAAASMYWILDPAQNRLQYNIGEVGVPTGVGLHTPGEVIQVDSFLRDIGNYLTACNPPAPPMPSKLGYASDDSITNKLVPGNTLPVQGLSNKFKQDSPIPTATFDNDAVLSYPSTKENFANNYIKNQREMNILPELNPNESQENLEKYVNLAKEKYMAADGSDQNFTDFSGTGPFTSRVVNANTFLLPDSGQNVKRSAYDISSVDWQAGFAGNAGNLHTDPQNLTYVIERMWEERGGLDQNDLIKKSWKLYTREHPNGPENLKGQSQQPTCTKIRQPYPIDAPFGLKFNQTSTPFNAIDVIAQGKSSPRFGQEVRLPFNYHAPYVNGGCNNISMVKNEQMCSDNNNDLTGVHQFNWKDSIPPLGI